MFFVVFELLKEFYASHPTQVAIIQIDPDRRYYPFLMKTFF